MTKTQLWKNVSTQVEELLANSKVSKKFSEELMYILEVNLMPKSGGGNSMNPPKEIDGVMNYYCRYHQQYEPVDNMVMSKGKSKGYCKAAISKWNKANANAKKLESQAVEAMSNGDFEKAQEFATKAKDLKAVMNNPEYYNYEEDWAEFTK